MEKRIILTTQEALRLLDCATVHSKDFVIEHYSGIERLRLVNGVETLKKYQTPVSGEIYRYSLCLSYKGCENVWLEFKWTKKCQRWEVEFEAKIPCATHGSTMLGLRDFGISRRVWS